MEKELPIHYSCHIAQFREGEQFVETHGFSMVLSGTMELNDGEKTTKLKEGELYLVTKNRLLKFVKHPPANGAFKSLSIRFDEKMLRDFSLEYGYKPDGQSVSATFIKLPKDETLLAFMQSLLSYESLLDDKSTIPVLHLKQKEALLLLLQYDASLKNILFDFAEPHKIDLEAFMQKNFHFNVQLERFAYLTGRSLATFKRDFEKIFSTTPGRWLQKKRLQEAYYLITKKGKMASDIYLDLGFENLSHFSYAFKKVYGEAPSRIIG